MIPKVDHVLQTDFEFKEQPSKTYGLNLVANKVVGHIDGLEAIKQAIFKILSTERYQYAIYNWDYGIELKSLFGKPRPYVYSELKRRIREALMQDDRITDVGNFIFDDTVRRKAVSVEFTVYTTIGDIGMQGEFDV